MYNSTYRCRLSSIVPLMEKMIIAYCRDNMDLAQLMDEQLSRIGLNFEHITNAPGQTPGQFAGSLQHSQSPVFLLITDNLLRNLSCMAGLTDTVKSLLRAGRLLIIVADGIREEEDTREVQKVPTRFDKVIHAIQYLNHWQLIYLENNAQIEQLPESQKPAALERLTQIRLINDQVSDLLHTIKNSEYYYWDDFKKNHFEAFFIKFGLQDWHEQFKSLQSKKGITTNHEVIAPPLQEQQITQMEEPEAPSPAKREDWKRILDDLEEEDELEDELRPEESNLESEQIVKSKSQPTDSQPVPTAADNKPVDYAQFISEEKKRIQALFALGETQDAIQTARKLMLQYPEDDGLRFFYAQQLSLHTNQPDEATRILAELQKQQFPHHKILELRGDLAFQNRDPIAAKEWWESALEEEPDAAQIHLKLGNLLETHFKGAKRKAADHYHAAAELLETDAQAWLRHANILLEYLDKPRKAAKSYQKATRYAPKNAEAWYGLALSAHHAGDTELARLAYQNAVSLQSSMRSDVLDKLLVVKQEPQIETAPPKEVLTVLITGATSGIGAATASRFLEEGHCVIAVGRRTEKLKQLHDSLTSEQQGKLLTYTLDVRHAQSVQQLADNLPTGWQDIDVLINNAGLALGLAPIHEGDLSDWDTMIDTNIKGMLYMTRAIAPQMVARRKGHIVNIGSSAGKEVYPKGNVYCATKWAVEALTKGMRLDLHQFGIRVSQVSPGHVEETEFALTRFHGDADKAKIYEDFQPLTSRDVADAIFYLVTRPDHVNVQDVQLFGTQQASSTVIDRSGRKTD